MWGSIPECQDPTLSRRQTLKDCATQAPLTRKILKLSIAHTLQIMKIPVSPPSTSPISLLLPCGSNANSCSTAWFPFPKALTRVNWSEVVPTDECFFKSAPGNSTVQLRLRTTVLKMQTNRKLNSNTESRKALPGVRG